MERAGRPNRLGRPSAEQLQAALDRFGLGRLVRAEPVPFGNFGQTCFLDSTEGRWVLRGAPLWPGQFAEERFFAEQIHRQTDVPSPWPYLVDESADTFGWAYAILPRLPGVQLADRDWLLARPAAERSGIANALGEGLARLQVATWHHAGRYDAVRGEVVDEDRVAAARRDLERARRQAPAVTTAADAAWVEAVIRETDGAAADPRPPCLVDGDYKEDNVVVERPAGAWRLAGVFDLGLCWFGDGEAALCRQTAIYLDDDPRRATDFVRAYRSARPPAPGFAERFRLAMLLDRLQLWEWAQRERTLWWEPALTLREWARPYVDWK